MPRLQYQQRGQVPPASGAASWKERILLDKWEPEYPQMRRSLLPALSAAILAGALFFVPPAHGSKGWQSVPQVDAWRPVVVDCHYPKPRLSRAIVSGWVAAEVPPVAPSDWKERIRADKWLPELPDNPLPRRVLPTSIQAVSPSLVYVAPPPEPILADKWGPEYPDYFPRPQLSRGIVSGSMAAEVPPVAPSDWKERITADKWLPELPDNPLPRPYFPRAIQAGHLFLGDLPRAETIAADKWGPEYPDFFPKPQLSRAIVSGSTAAEVPPVAPSDWNERIGADKWLPELPDNPVTRRALAPAVQAGALSSPVYVPAVPESIFADKWRPVYPDYFPRPQLSRAIVSGSMAAEVPPVAPSDWKERITADKWLPDLPDNPLPRPYFSRAAQAGHLFLGDLPRAETIAVDKWLPKLPDNPLPRPFLSRAIYSGALFVGDIPRKEGIRLDKWQPCYLDRIPVLPSLAAAIRAGSCFYRDALIYQWPSGWERELTAKERAFWFAAREGVYRLLAEDQDFRFDAEKG